MELLENFNWIDIVVLVLVVRGIYLGIRHGLTAELFNFIGILVSLVLAVQYYSQIADALIINFGLPIWLCQFLCFVIIAQLIRLIVKYCVILFLRVLNIQFVPHLERIGGGVVGLGRSIIISALLMLSLTLLSSGYMTGSIYDKSFSGSFLIKVAERTYRSLVFWMPEEDQESMIFIAPASQAKAKKF